MNFFKHKQSCFADLSNCSSNLFFVFLCILSMTWKIASNGSDTQNAIRYYRCLKLWDLKQHIWLVIKSSIATLFFSSSRIENSIRCLEPRLTWPNMQAVKDALEVPVLANGNIQTLHDVHRCMEYTGADGVMSAESLLEDPALFAARRLQPSDSAHLEGCKLLLEYLDLLEQYPCPTRMVRGHVFKLLGKTICCQRVFSKSHWLGGNSGKQIFKKLAY